MMVRTGHAPDAWRDEGPSSAVGRAIPGGRFPVAVKVPGRPVSEETRAKLSAAQLGRSHNMTPEGRAALAAARRAEGELRRSLLEATWTGPRCGVCRRRIAQRKDNQSWRHIGQNQRYGHRIEVAA